MLLCTTTFSAYALTKNESSLIQAAAKGDVKKVKSLLKKFDKNKDKVDAFQEQQRVAGEEGYMIIPPGLSALQEVTHEDKLTREALKTLRRSYWLALPKQPTHAGKGNSTLHNLDAGLIKQLELLEP